MPAFRDIYSEETRNKLYANGRQIPSRVSRGINCGTRVWAAIILVVIECSTSVFRLSLSFSLLEDSRRPEKGHVNRIISALALSSLTITRNLREDKVQARITLCIRPVSGSPSPQQLSKTLEHPVKGQLSRQPSD